MTAITVIDRHRDAIAAAHMFAREAVENPRLLIVLGTVGVGKTNLVRSILAETSANGRCRIHVFTACDLAFRMVEAFRCHTFDSIPGWFGRGDFLVVEDLGDIAAWCRGDIRRAVGALRQLQFEATLRR